MGYQGLVITVALAGALPQGGFNPVEFFRGTTHGEGILKVIFQSPEKITVDSEGTQLSDGTLVLKQTIHQPGTATRIRYWRLRQSAPNHFEGTLTDAAGPVSVDESGNSVRISYRAKNHLYFDQTLTPAGDKAVQNRTKISRFGIIVAHFNEAIRKRS